MIMGSIPIKRANTPLRIIMSDFDETSINDFYIDLYKRMNPSVVSNSRFGFVLFDKFENSSNAESTTNSAQIYIETYKDGKYCGTTYSDELLAFNAIESSKMKNSDSSILKDRIKMIYSKLDEKNSWGKNELKQMFLETLADV